MLYYLLIFSIALVLTLIFTPVVKKIAFLFNAIDIPSGRKVHTKEMPRLGGLGIFMGFIVAVLIAILIAYFRNMGLHYKAIWGILLGAVFILSVGIVDDVKGIPAAQKLILQIIGASIPIFFGVQIYFVSSPFSGIILMGWFAIPLTLFWIVGMTNAVNFIDGLDGLASGIAAIAATTLFIVAVRIHQPAAAIMMAALAGATIGFLRYNFNPASIFLGDSGSMFLGYILAVSSVIGVLKSTIVLALLIPVLILGVPIFDTASVILRRVRAGDPIFNADRRHLHHRLLDKGFSQRQVVISIHLICIFLCIATLSLTFLRFTHAIIVLALIIALVYFGMGRIKKYIRRFVVVEK